MTGPDHDAPQDLAAAYALGALSADEARRFELRSDCPNCGEHSTIARMSDTANVECRSCGGSMLLPI